MLKTENTHFNIGILNVDSLFADAFLRLLKSCNDNLTIKHVSEASIASFYSFDILFVHQSRTWDYLNFLLSQKSNIKAHETIYCLNCNTSLLLQKDVTDTLKILDLTIPVNEIKENLQQHVRKINKGKAKFGKPARSLTVLSRNFQIAGHFSDEELNVIYSLRKHICNKQISESCKISVSTLKRRLKAIADKCGVPNNKTAILCYLYERM